MKKGEKLKKRPVSVKKMCPSCKNIFSEKYWDKKHCSQECYFKSLKGREVSEKHRKNLSISHKANNPEWLNELNSYRQRAMEYYKKECSVCAKKIDGFELIVHHKDGRNCRGGNHSLENLVVLCRTCHNKITQKQTKKIPHLKVQNSVTEMMAYLGLDLKDEQLKETPRRVAMMFEEIFEGLKKENEPRITLFKSKNYDQMIISKFTFKSTCAHHFVPFIGTCFVGYIPDKHIIGLSKIYDIIEYFAKRPQIQEQLTTQIIDYFDNKVNPKGCMIEMRAKHFCTIIRDIEQPEAETETITSAIKGIFTTDDSAKQEFLLLRQKI